MPQITLILHDIRSTHNVGSIFRTAEGFGVHEIICSGYTPYPRIANDRRLPHLAEKLHKQIHKTALDAESLVPFRHFEKIADWFNENKQKNNLPLFALEQSANSIVLGSFQPPEKFALLLGEEVDGVDSKLLELCKEVIEIPMVGRKESFNVSVAAAIALYEFSR